MTRPVRIAYVLSHPIQYQSFIVREMATQPDLGITVFYGLDTVTHGSFDRDFGRKVQWDVPLLDGYKYEFLPSLLPTRTTTPRRVVNRGLRQRLREGGFDMLWLHGWGRFADLLALRDAKALGLPVLMRTENNFRGTSRPRPGCIQGFKESIKHWVMAQCDAFGYMGEAGYDYFRAYRVPHKRLFDMPFVVDNAWWQQASEDARTRGEVQALRRQYGIKDDRPVVVYVGKFTRRKGIIELLRAYKRLPEQEQPHLLLVGCGEMEVEARKQAEGLSRVYFAGFRNQGELPAYFSAADLFAIPSRDEQWGVVVNEAMNCGCAVLASDECGSAPELVIPGETGVVYPAGDDDALLESLEKILADHERLKVMGKNARTRVNEYGIDKVLFGLRECIAYLSRQGLVH